ncbi:hypothetical protein [Caulobacter sp. S45]|uniref:hypothetical protein n=1 Tax=Caulobacter sp. S45 TaxID=1641861 RepID=UPI0015754070|nr:hypothetical protein [Caulobacter sp. S45]
MTVVRGRRLALAATAALALTTAAGALKAEPDPTAGMVRLQGAYANAEYGFRFSTPSGTTVLRARAPAPNHGGLVLLGPGRRIEVSAAFDAPGYGSTAALLAARLPATTATPVRPRPARLGGRAAEAATYRKGAEVHLLVVRHEGDPDTGINYTAELTSTFAAAPTDRAAFARLLATFRFTPRE